MVAMVDGPLVGAPLNFPSPAGGGGDVTDGVNIGGAPGELFKAKLGTLLQFRTLVGVNGAVVSTVGDTVEIDGGGAISPVLSASFLDNATLDLPVGSQATDGQILVDMSLFDAATNRTKAIQWVFAVSSAAVAADIVEVDTAPPGVQVEPSAQAIAGNVVARLTGTGPGNLVEVRFRVLTIPRL
jgi:hypothetical protein